MLLLVGWGSYRGARGQATSGSSGRAPGISDLASSSKAQYSHFTKGPVALLLYHFPQFCEISIGVIAGA
jgi:hypothetical protein